MKIGTCTCVFAAALSLTCIAQADVTWTGAIDTTFSTNGNWTGTAPGTSSAGIFAGDAGTMNQPHLTASRSVLGLNFQTAGWVLDSDVGAGFTIGTSGIASAGAGINTLSASLVDAYTTFTISADTANTLILSGDYSQRRNWIVTGAGTVVLNGSNLSAGNIANQFNANLVYLNGIWPSTNNMAVGDNATLAGVGGLSVYQFQTSTFGANTTLSPGGDNTLAPRIGTFTFDAQSATSRGSVTLDPSTSVVIDLGNTVGQCDQIFLTLNASAGGRLNLNDSILNLVGTTPIPDGDYTILATGELTASTVYSGSFSAINYNGSAINPANFSISYNTDSIVVHVAGMNVPEPATLGLIAAGGLLMLRGDRKPRA